MTAFELIDDIFRRPNLDPRLASNVRRITAPQFSYLRSLIEKEGPDEAIRRGAPGSLVWTPMGLSKYVLTEDLAGKRHTLMRLQNIVPSDCGMLF